MYCTKVALYNYLSQVGHVFAVAVELNTWWQVPPGGGSKVLLVVPGDLCISQRMSGRDITDKTKV